jgi:acetate kinase
MGPSEHPILCINSGSSSVKFALYQCNETDATLLANGTAKGIGSPDARLSIMGTSGETLADVQDDFPQLTAAIHTLLDRLAQLNLPQPVAVGHRVVHGGTAYTAPQRVDAKCLDTLRKLIPFAPLHQPSASEGIEAIVSQLPGLPQVACFDTAFHHGLPELVQRFPLSRSLWRGGDLDPGILLYLMQAKGACFEQLARLVNHEAGLLGMSNLSSDMQILLDKRESEPQAAQAVELFCYELRKQIGALTAVLGGLDTLVFTGGIGERAAPVRWEVCQGLAYLGLELDAQRNKAHARVISSTQSVCCVRVVPTNEELMIARHTCALLLPGASAGR